MTTLPTGQSHKVYFYAPDKETHRLFEQDWEEVIKAKSSNLTTWIIGTYSHIRQAGIACEIVDTLPRQGIVIADRDTLGNHYPYLGKVMLICAKADREFHPSAYTHVVQNSADLQNRQNSLWRPYYIPHWLQPGLIGRSVARGTLVENIAFIGTRSNLAKEFYDEKWTRALAELGCVWQPLFSPAAWADYSDIDAVVAVRSFDGQTYAHKPASKLVNCWRAGVPAILAPESAFLSIQKSALDFQAVSSIEEAIAAVKQLKEDPALYLSIVNNGWERAQEFSDEKITEHWVEFFQTTVFPDYDRWIQASEVSRLLSFSQRYAKLKVERVQNRLTRRLNSP